MLAKLLHPVLGSLGLTQIRHVSAVSRRRATGLVAQVYQQMEREFGVLAPPVALHSSAPDILAAVWILLRETLIAPGHAPRGTKEAVATAVSVGNACPYCATIHHHAMTVLGKTGVLEIQVADEFGSLAGWLQSSRRPGGPARPPFPADQMAELVGVAVLMHYLNRVVNVLLRDIPLPQGMPEFTLSPVLRVLGWMMRRAARHPHEPGASLELLPAAPLPGDLVWASADDTMAQAFSRVCAVMDAAGQRTVPAAVRELVQRQLSTWHGGLRGISRRWVDDLVTELPREHQNCGRLALLVAFASYQVDAAVVESCRSEGMSDRQLVELCSWSATAAARRAGVLLSTRPVG
jgi:AhpD family alkylhydroperoxidase